MRWCKKGTVLCSYLNEEPSLFIIPAYSFLRIQEAEPAVSAFITEVVVIIVVAVPVFVVIVVRVDLAL